MQIVPNSAVVIQPYPYDEPSQWIVTQLISPAEYKLLVFLTGMVLLSLLCLILTFMYFKERRWQKKERESLLERIIW